MTGPFTRRREAAAPVEERRPVLRLATGKGAPAKAGPAKGPSAKGAPAKAGPAKEPSAKGASAKRATAGAPGRKAPGRPSRAGTRGGTEIARAKGAESPGRKRRRATEATEELRRLAGGNANRAVDTLARASEAFARGRERDALRMLRPLTEAYPGAAAVRELAGLCRYRIGSYAAAADDLAAFADLTGSTEQHPVLMDCRRALGKLREVEELWEELRETSPSAALVTEGRIVLAGALADAGRLAEAIDLLGRRSEVAGRTKEHTVRLWYALADLHERAGDVPRARALFEQVQKFDAEFADVAERLAALS
ncbi:MAG TPA: tetratricopeptide repeat protein [Acidimicrobiia bacterium]